VAKLHIIVTFIFYEENINISEEDTASIARWKWIGYTPQKHRYPPTLHDAITQKTRIHIICFLLYWAINYFEEHIPLNKLITSLQTIFISFYLYSPYYKSNWSVCILFLNMLWYATTLIFMLTNCK
jgi:hypothetical protein